MNLGTNILTRNTREVAFTLIELLVSLAVIAVLAAVILPVLFSAKAKARQATCSSNLHQLGLAVAAYAQDYDQHFPYGGDVEDLHTTVWRGQSDPSYAPLVAAMQPIQNTLSPYVHSPLLWKCPSDTGLSFFDVCGGNVSLSAKPSLYDAYGSSYTYNTLLALQQATLSGVVGYEPNVPYTQHGPSEIYLMSDASGEWHGSATNRTFNVLMVDGHVQPLTHDDLITPCTLVFKQPILVPPTP